MNFPDDPKSMLRKNLIKLIANRAGLNQVVLLLSLTVTGILAAILISAALNYP